MDMYRFGGCEEKPCSTVPLSSRLPAAMSGCSTTQVQLSWSDTGWGRGAARACGKLSSRAHWLGAETCHASGTCSTVR